MEFYPILCKILDKDVAFTKPSPRNMHVISIAVTQKALELIGSQKLQKMLVFLNENSSGDQDGGSDEFLMDVSKFVFDKMSEMGMVYDDCLYNRAGKNLEDFSDAKINRMSRKAREEFKQRKNPRTAEQHIQIGCGVIEAIYSFCEKVNFSFEEWEKGDIKKNGVKLEIPVVTRLQDNQDGGYTMYVYNNHDEMFKQIEEDSGEKLSQEKKQEILDGTDEYENGYLDTDTITIDIENGTARLSKPISFHAGQ
jgi:hypothetical protein